MSHASPSITRWTKLPRWLRAPGPRSQSSTEMTMITSTAPRATTNSLGQVILAPDSEQQPEQRRGQRDHPAEIGAHAGPALADHDPETDCGHGDQRGTASTRMQQ